MPLRHLVRLCLACAVLACHLPLAVVAAMTNRRRPGSGGAARPIAGRVIVVSPFEPGDTSGGARAVKDFLTLVNARRAASLVVISGLSAPGILARTLGSILSWPLSVPPQCRPLLTSWRRLTRELEGTDTVVFEHFAGALGLFFGRPAVRHLVIRDHEVQIRKIQNDRQRSRGLEAAVHAVRMASCYLISRQIFASADRIVTLTAEDRDALLYWFPFVTERTTTIPVPFDAPARPVGRPAPTTPALDLLMIGNFFHRPNVDALQWFLKQCAPHLAPGFRLHVCGLDTPLDAVNLTSANLSVVRHGFVEDVDRAVPEATIAVAPVVSGGGVRIKNLLLASLGKAIVTTSLGNQGIGFVDRRDAVVTDDAREMAERINELSRAPQELARLGAGGRAFVQAQFGAAAILERFEHELFA